MINQLRPPNFEIDTGGERKLYLVRCYRCDPEWGMENWAPMVPQGRCAFCGWPDDMPDMRAGDATTDEHQRPDLDVSGGARVGEEG